MKLSYSQIETYCNEMHKIASEMKDLIEKVQGVGKQVESSSSWEGNASTFYSEKLQKLISVFEPVFVELENAVLYLAKSAEGFEAVDKQVLKEICASLHIDAPTLSKSKIFS